MCEPAIRKLSEGLNYKKVKENCRCALHQALRKKGLKYYNDEDVNSIVEQQIKKIELNAIENEGKYIICIYYICMLYLVM